MSIELPTGIRITKDEFVSIMTVCKNQCDIIEPLIKTNILSHGNPFSSMIDSIFDFITNLVEPNYDKHSQYEPIIYSYAYNHNWGQKYESNIKIIRMNEDGSTTEEIGESYLIEINGIKCKPSTFEELYDVLVLLANP